MPPFLAPDTAWLRSRLDMRNQRRMRSVLRRLTARTRAEKQALAALRVIVRTPRGSRRRELLLRPDVRAWLWQAEEALTLLRPPRSASRLFEWIASGPHMARLMPRGRLDRATRARCLALGRSQLAAVLDRLPAMLAFAIPESARVDPLPLRAPPDAEEARPSGVVHIWHPAPLALRVPSGSRVELLGPAIRLHVRGRGSAPLRPRPLLPGTGIVLADRAVRAGGALRTGPPVPGLERRLARALALIRIVWREAHREVLVHTRVIVPLEEPGTVSFSQPARPGVSYINVRGKSIVDLADDLIHESAHHRLHGLEELGSLVIRDDAAFYHSPWRRGPRPLRGILHACYTFTWRAELIRRLLASKQRLPRRRLRADLAFESAALSRGLAHLADARGRGLLTPAGARLVRQLAARLDAPASVESHVLERDSMILYGHSGNTYSLERPRKSPGGQNRGKPWRRQEPPNTSLSMRR